MKSDNLAMPSMASTLLELEAEVQRDANLLSLEVLLRLVSKLEQESDRLPTSEFLSKYVTLKLSLHHLKKKYNMDWWNVDSYQVVNQKILNLSKIVKKARKEYYVSKRRNETEHGFNCTCRGCRCVKELI